MPLPSSQAIEVDDSYDRVHRKTWVRRTAGFLTGTTIGSALGGIIGAVAAFLPYVFGVIGVTVPVAVPLAAAVASSAALLAGVGGFIGLGIATDVGASAGSASAALEEKERREKQEMIASGKELAPLPSENKEPVKDVAPPMFNWKVAAVGFGLFGAFGAMIALSPLTASAVALLGFKGATVATATAAAQSASTAGILASGITLGMMGTTIGLPMSYISNKVSNFYTKLITGQYFEKEPEKSVAPETERQPSMPNATEYVMNEPEHNGKCFASETPRFSMRGLIEKTEGVASDTNIVVGR